VASGPADKAEPRSAFGPSALPPEEESGWPRGWTLVALPAPPGTHSLPRVGCLCGLREAVAGPGPTCKSRKTMSGVINLMTSENRGRGPGRGQTWAVPHRAPPATQAPGVSWRRHGPQRTQCLEVWAVSSLSGGDMLRTCKRHPQGKPRPAKRLACACTTVDWPATQRQTAKRWPKHCILHVQMMPTAYAMCNRVSSFAACAAEQMRAGEQPRAFP